MKTIQKYLLTAAGASMLLAGSAQAHTGIYVGVNVGNTDLTDLDTSSPETPAIASRTLDIDSDDDTSFGFKLGYNVLGDRDENRFNVELYYQNSEHDAESLNFNSGAINFEDSAGNLEGDLEVETILLRATYEIELGAIDPYFGIGIGQSDLDVDVRYGGSVGSASGTQPPFASSSDDATAIEIRIGGEYSVSKNVGIYLEYSYLKVDDVTFSRTGNGPEGLATTEQTDDFSVDSLNLGVNFKF